MVMVLVMVLVAVAFLPLIRHRFSRPSSPHEGAGTEALDCTDGARDSPISHGKPRLLPGPAVRHAVTHGRASEHLLPGALHAHIRRRCRKTLITEQ